MSVEPDSELVCMGTEEAFGVVVEPGDVAAIAAGIEKLATGHEQWTSMQKNAEKCAHEMFSEAAILDRWSALIRELKFGVQ